MRKVLIFGEDYGHEIVLKTLLKRLEEDYGVPLNVQVRSALGGHGRMLSELKAFLSELQRGQATLPDLFVVARDANCLGYSECAREIGAAVGDYGGSLAKAVPDPHIERWLLIDPQAFRQALGRGCQAPDQKCDRDRYKMLLNAAVRAAGIEPLLGGLEFAEDIVRAMNWIRAEKADDSFSHLLRDLRAAFQRWKSQ